MIRKFWFLQQSEAVENEKFDLTINSESSSSFENLFFNFFLHFWVHECFCLFCYKNRGVTNSYKKGNKSFILVLIIKKSLSKKRERRKVKSYKKYIVEQMNAWKMGVYFIWITFAGTQSYKFFFNFTKRS